jgi:predicted transcriptional regulator
MDKSEQARKAQWHRKKLGGPQKRELKPGERVALSLRMTPGLKRRLDAAADANGRSQSQEAEFRLEQSFDRQELLADALTTAYGSKEVAGLVMLIGDALQNAGSGQYALFRSWPEVLTEGRGAWMANSEAYAQATDAVHRILEALRPQESHGPDQTAAQRPKKWFRTVTIDNETVKLGKWCAERRLKSIIALGDTCGSADDAADPRPHTFEITVRNLLGPTATRIFISHADDDHASTESRPTKKGKHQEPKP